MNERGEYKEHLTEPETLLWSEEMRPELKDKLIELVHEVFPDLPVKFVEQIVSKRWKHDVIILLNDQNKKRLIGFTQAHIYSGDPTLANVGMTGIIPDKQKQGLVSKLMTTLEAELQKRGVKYMTRSARVSNGYADAIERHYGARIIEKQIEDTKNTPDPRRSFKIQL